jgi:hypothetical protein
MNTFHRQEHDFPLADGAERPVVQSGPAALASVAILSYFDVVALVVAAPIVLLIGVPAAGYAIGAGAWILLRAAGVAVERAIGRRDVRTQVSARLGYMLGRLFLLALAVIVARQSAGKDDGLTALIVIVFAFTIQLGISAVNRPRSR